MSATFNPDFTASFQSRRQPSKRTAIAKIGPPRTGLEIAQPEARLQAPNSGIFDASRLTRRRECNLSEGSQTSGDSLWKTDRTKPSALEKIAFMHGCNSCRAPSPTGPNCQNEAILHMIFTIEPADCLPNHLRHLPKLTKRSHSSHDLHNSRHLAHDHDGMNSVVRAEPSKRSHSSHDLHESRVQAPSHDGMNLAAAGKPSKRSHSSRFLHNRSAGHSVSRSAGSWAEIGGRPGQPRRTCMLTRTWGCRPGHLDAFCRSGPMSGTFPVAQHGIPGPIRMGRGRSAGFVRAG